MCLKIAWWVTNSEDPDQMLHSVAFDLGLYCSNTWDKCSNLFQPSFHDITKSHRARTRYFRTLWILASPGKQTKYAIFYSANLIFSILFMLNKLRCHAHFFLSANQIAWSRLLIQIHTLNGKQCRSRLVGFWRSQLIWIYTLLQSQDISRFSRTKVNISYSPQIILFSFIF